MPTQAFWREVKQFILTQTITMLPIELNEQAALFGAVSGKELPYKYQSRHRLTTFLL